MNTDKDEINIRKKQMSKFFDPSNYQKFVNFDNDVSEIAQVERIEGKIQALEKHCY